MRMIFKKLALIFTLFLAFLACDKEKNLDVASQSPGVLQKKFFVSKEEARALVETLQRNRRTTEINGKEVNDIATFTDRAGIAIFYVINFKDDKGHLLLSADKRMKPVLAFSDTGIFDLETDNPGIQLWKDFIAEHAAGIRGKIEASIDIINEWRQFEIGQGAGFKTTDQPVWTPEASCEYFVTHPIPPNVTIQHLTYGVAHWLQGKGYNAHCPNGIVVPNCTKSGIFPCGKAPVGCGPLAIGQVLKYHHKAVTVEGTNYTEAMLNGMPMTHSGDCPPPDNTGNGNLSHLLRDIGKATGATYNTVVPALGVQCRVRVAKHGWSLERRMISSRHAVLLPSTLIFSIRRIRRQSKISYWRSDLSLCTAPIVVPVCQICIFGLLTAFGIYMLFIRIKMDIATSTPLTITK